MNHLYIVNTNYLEFYTKILINVILLFTFINILYFTYGIELEKDVTKKNIDYLMHDLSSNITLLNIKDKISNNICYLESSEPKINLHEESNNNLKTSSIILNIFLIVITIIIVVNIYFYSFQFKNNKLHIFEIIKECFIILLFVGIIEYFFLVAFCSRYISIDNNRIKLALLNIIYNKPHSYYKII